MDAGAGEELSLARDPMGRLCYGLDTGRPSSALACMSYLGLIDTKAHQLSQVLISSLALLHSAVGSATKLMNIRSPKKVNTWG